MGHDDVVTGQLISLYTTTNITSSFNAHAVDITTHYDAVATMKLVITCKASLAGC